MRACTRVSTQNGKKPLDFNLKLEYNNEFNKYLADQIKKGSMLVITAYYVNIIIVC